MLPGQIGLLIIGIVSVVALAILGVFSYLAFAKEKRQKEKEARAKRRAQWHESLKATADDDLSFSMDEAAEETTDEVVFEESEGVSLEGEDEFVENFDPFAMPEIEPEEEFVLEQPVVERPAPVSAPKAPERPKSTRNDFDFKF